MRESAPAAAGGAGPAEVQLTFVVQKLWERPDGQAGWTEQACAPASLRRVLEWMLEELPEDALTITRVAPGPAEKTIIEIDWFQVPQGIGDPLKPGRLRPAGPQWQAPPGFPG